MSWLWIVTAISIIGTVLNVYKKRACYYFWLVSNSIWLIVDIHKGIYEQALIFGVYTILAILGIVVWKKKP